MSKNGDNGSDLETIGCCFFIVLAIVAMPFLGLYLMLKKDCPALGLMMILFGLLLWGTLAAILICT